VAAVKGVILSINPEANIVDISHAVRRRRRALLPDPAVV
jgi:S-adenosylmethionine hydrolase